MEQHSDPYIRSLATEPAAKRTQTDAERRRAVNLRDDIEKTHEKNEKDLYNLRERSTKYRSAIRDVMSLWSAYQSEPQESIKRALMRKLRTTDRIDEFDEIMREWFANEQAKADRVAQAVEDLNVVMNENFSVVPYDEVPELRKRHM